MMGRRRYWALIVKLLEMERVLILEFCMANDTLINSWFQHKEIHKFTLENESQQRRSIIDYCYVVRRSLRSLVKGVKVVRGQRVAVTTT